MDTVIVSFVPTGSITAGVITFEVYDGAAWLPVKAARIESYSTEGTYTLGAGTSPINGYFSRCTFWRDRDLTDGEMIKYTT